MKRPLSLFAFILLVTISFSTTAKAEKVFTITSEPAGARVEINGQYVGTTPLQQKMKDFYFNGPKYLWSEWLNVPLQVTVSKRRAGR